jgi:ligand-binding sensor domain-containing protein
VTDVTFANDSIYGITETKLYRAAMSNPFLTDANQWQIDTRVPTPVNGKYWKVDALNDELFVVFQHADPGQDTIFKLTTGAFQPVVGQLFSAEIVDFEVSSGELMVSLSGGAVAYDASGNVLFNFASYGALASNPKAMIKWNGDYWVADNSSGLVRMANPWSYQFVRQDGPGNNTAFAINGNKGKMVVSSGVLDRVVFNFRNDGVYIMEEENWTNLNRFNQANWQSANVWDFGTAAVNAENPDQVAFGCYCIDGVSISVGGTVSDVYNPSNSGLEATTLGNGYACISSMEYDEEGNLWIANCYSNKPLKVLKADGNWVSYETGTTPKGVFTSKLVIDNAGNKWMGLYERGLLAYNNNGTIDNLSDDSYKVLQTGTGNGNLPSNNVTAVAVDFDDEIWIGTEDGFVVLYNSVGVFGATNVDASRILVNFEGNVEQLLDDTPISDIEIDGGNRKWIATASTGVFLLSADGQEVITHFTKENSPLISDNILDMEFDYQTGELFIVTDIGLVSYRSDATQGDPEYSNVTVFPNPVKPDYFGPITIQGIRYDSDVKITDVAGNLVYQTTSNGGTATWNGKTLTGENVPGGIYMIWTATNEKKDGQNKKVAKVAVIR